MKKAVAKKAVAKKAETLRSKLEKKLEKANANVDKAFVQYKSFLGKLYIRRGNQFVNAAELCIHDDGTFEHASKALGEQTLYLCRLNTKFGNFPFYEYYAGDKALLQRKAQKNILDRKNFFFHVCIFIFCFFYL